jgi:hypothetical protein
MTRDEAVTLLQSRLSRSNDTTIASSIVLEMRFVQEQILEKSATLPWFLISDSINLSTTSGSELMAVPTNVGSVTGRDFLRELEQDSMYIQDPIDLTWIQLEKDDLNALHNYYGDLTGQPKKYALINGYYHLFPIPDAVYAIKTRVYLREPRLTTNIENKWLSEAADLLIAETGIFMAENYLRDAGIVASFRDAVMQARQRLQIVHEAREHAARMYSMGGEDN